MTLGLGRRRRFLVDVLQGRLLALNSLYYWILVLLVAAVLFVPPILALRPERPFAEQERAAFEVLALHRRFWPAALFVYLLFALHTLLVGHRVAGPLVRLRRAFAEAAAGDLRSRVVLRRGDYLHREADAFNALLDAFEARLAAATAAAAAPATAAPARNGVTAEEAGADLAQDAAEVVAEEVGAGA